MDLNTKKSLVSARSEITISRQCELLGLNRTSFYYTHASKDMELEEKIKRRLDFWHSKMSYLGVRRLRTKLLEDKLNVGRKLIRRYLAEMGLYCMYPKPNLSKRNMQHKVFPYLLRNISIAAPNQVWAIDITYIPMGRSHMYLTAIIDWHSRYIVGWALADSLDTAPVLDAVQRAIEIYGKPGILNSDQGCQFTSTEYTTYLKDQNIRQSMDGKARWVDNVIIERWFRSLKCDNIYLNDYKTPRELRSGVAEYILEYNTERPHQSLDYKMPITVYNERKAA